MTDDARAALAAALRRTYRQEGWDSPIAQTAAILAAMPNWRLVPDAVPVDAERMRAALRTGVEIVTALTEWGGNCGGLPQTLQDRADWWRLDVDPALAPTD